MDRMTTLGAFAVTSGEAAARALARPAAAGPGSARLFGLGPTRTAGVSLGDAAGSRCALALAVVAVVFAPAAAARVAPFALLGYGFVGLFVAHYLLSLASLPAALRGRARPVGQRAVNLVLPEAFAFMAAALWLLVG